MSMGEDHNFYEYISLKVGLRDLSLYQPVCMYTSWLRWKHLPSFGLWCWLLVCLNYGKGCFNLCTSHILSHFPCQSVSFLLSPWNKILFSSPSSLYFLFSFFMTRGKFFKGFSFCGKYGEWAYETLYMLWSAVAQFWNYSVRTL